MRKFIALVLFAVSSSAMAANPIGPVNVPSMPGYVVDVEPSDTATFQPSVIIVAAVGTVKLTPASPANAPDVVWTTTVENFVVPGLYRAVKADGTDATDIKRIQINE